MCSQSWEEKEILPGNIKFEFELLRILINQQTNDLLFLYCEMDCHLQSEC